MAEKIKTEDTSDQIEVRRQKLQKIEEAGEIAYPNDFKPEQTASEIIAKFTEVGDEELKAAPVQVRIAGRIMSIRKFGKASFFHVQDAASRLQVYARSDRLGPEGYSRFSTLDIGDIVGVSGRLFRTHTKELTVEAEEIRLLAKCLRPL